MARLVRHEAKGPIKIEPQEKAVWVCACGLSRTFPICDKAHKACVDEPADELCVYDPESLTVVERRPLPETKASEE